MDTVHVLQMLRVRKTLEVSVGSIHDYAELTSFVRVIWS